MEELDRTNTWTPNGVDSTPPGTETLKAYRTVHGIVSARGKVNGKEVAFVTARSTYFHEADSALFFTHMNNPSFMKDGPASFRRAAKQMNFAFNWSYIDSEHIAYYLTGWYPKRARGTSPDFPILGTGKYDWKGFDPARHMADWLGSTATRMPSIRPISCRGTTSRRPGGRPPTISTTTGRSIAPQLIADRVRSSIRGGRKASLAGWCSRWRSRRPRTCGR